MRSCRLLCEGSRVQRQCLVLLKAPGDLTSASLMGSRTSCYVLLGQCRWVAAAFTAAGWALGALPEPGRCGGAAPGWAEVGQQCCSCSKPGAALGTEAAAPLRAEEPATWSSLETVRLLLAFFSRFLPSLPAKFWIL